ncbi:MAG: hypothetical protein KTR29_07875 [Rhodothermaceae bacterium]|nr:hypothetical protein [Rhodothermaceae bacterium]
MTHNETPNSVMRLIRTGGPIQGATFRITKPRPLRKVVENGQILPEYAHIVIYDEAKEESLEPSLIH